MSKIEFDHFAFRCSTGEQEENYVGKDTPRFCEKVRNPLRLPLQGYRKCST